MGNSSSSGEKSATNGASSHLLGQYYRHYPKEVFQQKTEAQLNLFRSASFDFPDISISTGAEAKSPARKRAKIVASLPSTSSFASLQSCPEYKLTTNRYFTNDEIERLPLVDDPIEEEECNSNGSNNSSSNNNNNNNSCSSSRSTRIPSWHSDSPPKICLPLPDTSADLHTFIKPPTPPVSVTISNDISLDSNPPSLVATTEHSTTDSADDERSKRATTPKPSNGHPGMGPITEQVLAKGLTAKFRSISSWILPEPANSDGSVCKSMASKVTSRLGAIKNLKSRKRKRQTPSIASSQISTTDSTMGSLYSLNDGRTPWPIPWLEAIFLPEYPNKSPINESQFSIVGTIASGTFGKVYRVCLKADASKVYAMKVQNKSLVISRAAIKQVKDEATIHESIGYGAFVAGFYASWQNRSQLYTVLEYCSGYGDLYLLWRDFGPLQEKAVAIYAAEIAIALDYIHSHGVIYRDLKMENIVLDERGHCQLVDFGLAKWLQLGDRTATICGTLQYMAPEVAGGGPYTHSIDWWSLGVLINILLTSKFPFPVASAKHHMSLRFDSMALSDDSSAEARSLIIDLLSFCPNRRLQSLSDFTTHPFVSSLNFEKIAHKTYSPLDFVPMRKASVSLADRMDSDVSTTSKMDENMAEFAEQYADFSTFDYFNDRVDQQADILQS